MILPAHDDEENQQDEQRRPLLSEDDSNNDAPLHNCLVPNLPLALQILYGMNGLTLALPTSAYLYITNTRVQMPVSMLPSYAAIAFLPYSLKPLYAALSVQHEHCHNHVLLSVLLLLSGLITVATAWIPATATSATSNTSGIHVGSLPVLLCCAAAFARGILSAWPELLLEWTLVKYQTKFAVHSHASERVSVASTLQAQAATARNIGSVLAQIVSFMIWFRQPQWNDKMVTILLCIAGACNGIGALVAWMARVGANDDHNVVDTQQLQQQVEFVENSSLTRSTSYNSCTCEEEPLMQQSAVCSGEESNLPLSTTTPTSSAIGDSASGNIRLVLYLQLTIILLALRQPIQESTPHGSWFILVVGTVLALLLVSSAVIRCTAWKSSHYVGLYLILRNAIPTVSYVMDSFIYTALSKSAPVILQIFSLLDMIVTTLASWSYQRLFSAPKLQQQERQGGGGKDNNLLLKTIVFTTLLAGIASLGHLVTIHVLSNQDKLLAGIIWTALIKSIVSITSEWKFLPDVILATLSSSMVSHEGLATYSSLISCIDFGGQLGALLLGVLVSLVGTSRENHWAHMDRLVCLGACSCIGSAALVVLLLPKKS